MQTSTLIKRNLIHYWRTNLAVVLGVATAVAVLAGALLVGDSVRASLRDLFLGLYLGIDLTHPPHGLHAFHDRHPQVEQGDVGPVALGTPRRPRRRWPPRRPRAGRAPG